MIGQAVGVRREESRDLGASSRLEIALGDEGNDLMTLVAPSERAVWRRQRDRDEKAGGKTLRDGSPTRHHASSVTGSIKLGSLFLTFPTRALTGQHVISSVG